MLEENLDQLYDDLFIETCADWAIPYIGDLIGYEPLHALGQARGLARAEVAHTIALRRRKGTAAVLEQLARDVTGWNARAVEYFQLLGTTQYMNHLRPANHYAPDLRRREPLARIGGAFESITHTADVRRIESGRGRFNIPNIGIFLWRLNAYRHTASPAVRVDDRRYLVSPLGHPLQLFTNPRTEDEITHLADPINVPDPIRRRVMSDRLALYYGTRAAPPPAPVDNADPSIVLYVDGAEVPRTDVVVCNLSDVGAGLGARGAGGLLRHRSRARPRGGGGRSARPGHGGSDLSLRFLRRPGRRRVQPAAPGRRRDHRDTARADRSRHHRRRPGRAGRQRRGRDHRQRALRRDALGRRHCRWPRDSARGGAVLPDLDPRR